MVAQIAANRAGLLAAPAVEGHVALSLQAILGIVGGLAMAHENNPVGIGLRHRSLSFVLASRPRAPKPLSNAAHRAGPFSGVSCRVGTNLKASRDGRSRSQKMRGLTQGL